VADWGGGMSASCTAGPIVSFHFGDCKALLTQVSSAVESVMTFNL